MIDYTAAALAFRDLKAFPNHEIGAGLITYVEDLASNGWPGFDQTEIDTILVFLQRFSNAMKE